MAPANGRTTDLKATELKTTELRWNAVVFATDFSVCSQNAGLYAALLAKRFSTKLLVAHAFILAQAAMEVEIEESLISQQRKDLQILLSQKAHALSHGSMEADPVLPVLLDGDPKIALPELAGKTAPALLVLGTHGRGWVQRELMGSVAEAVLRSASCPCLTVGPHVPSVSSKASPFERILCVTDLTPATAGAAAYAVFFAEAFAAGIDVLNVVQREAIDRPDTLRDLTGPFSRALESVAPQQAKAFCDPQTFVEAGDARDRILKHIQERSIDLLVLGIRDSSHPNFERRISEAFKLVIHAACPVLTMVG